MPELAVERENGVSADTEAQPEAQPETPAANEPAAEEAQPAAANEEQPPASSESSESSDREKAPILSFIEWVQAKVGAAAQVTNDIHQGIGRFIGTEDPGNPREVSFMRTPFVIAQDMLSATAGTPLRRIHEVIGNVGSEVRAIYRTFTRPILHPIDTLKNPGKYFANPLRIMTSVGSAARNVVNAPTQALSEIAQRGIGNPLQRLGMKLSFFGKPLEWLGRGINWLGKVPKRISEWATSPLQKVDDWAKERQ